MRKLNRCLCQQTDEAMEVSNRGIPSVGKHLARNGPGTETQSTPVSIIPCNVAIAGPKPR